MISAAASVSGSQRPGGRCATAPSCRIQYGIEPVERLPRDYDSMRIGFLAQGNQSAPTHRRSISLTQRNRHCLSEHRTTGRIRLRRTRIVLSSAEESGVLVPASVQQSLGRAYVAIRPERQNVYEVGIQQALAQYVSFSGAFYHKQSSDLQDNDNFLNTGIIFPHRSAPVKKRTAQRAG